MTDQYFSKEDIDEIMDDSAVTILTGWTETNSDVPCDEEAYRRRLSANHEGYMTKIQEALNSVSRSPESTK